MARNPSFRGSGVGLLRSPLFHGGAGHRLSETALSMDVLRLSSLSPFAFLFHPADTPGQLFRVQRFPRLNERPPIPWEEDSIFRRQHRRALFVFRCSWRSVALQAWRVQAANIAPKCRNSTTHSAASSAAGNRGDVCPAGLLIRNGIRFQLGDIYWLPKPAGPWRGSVVSFTIA
jgi:hypothetical protein